MLGVALGEGAAWGAGVLWWTFARVLRGIGGHWRHGAVLEGSGVLHHCGIYLWCLLMKGRGG
ncbi:hypothetical protein [Bartonella jaculi]|uniref:hypothetical protein n=1 Tax=Bartonella jaculi TaxID=686226 RepID=UPI0031E732D1